MNSIKKSLEVRGFNVVAVDRGEKAVEESKKNRFDIALVDLKMPGIDGEETLKLLKKQHEWMEVVILTGHGSIESAIECTQSGAYKYLQKPCELEVLLDVLKDAYKAKVMNKKQIDEKKMDEMLRAVQGSTAREILEKIREIENET